MFNKQEAPKAIRLAADEFYFDLLALMQSFDNYTWTRDIAMLMAINDHRNELMLKLGIDRHA